MDSKAQLTVDTIAKVAEVAEGKIDIVNAAKLLNKSRRTIERYLQRYRYIGIQFIIHQNTGKTAYNKTCDKTKRKVQALIKKKYFDLNLTHLGEILFENEGIDVRRETLRGWAHESHHVKRAKSRWSQIRKRRERMESPGLLLQMDGSTHRWFGDKKSCLITLIEDATSEVHAEFFDAETTLGCMKVLRDYIERKGLFKVLYVDKAGIFCGPKRCNFSQVKSACEELGIEIIFANTTQGKGRIEHSFDTFQNRLIPELRLKCIKRVSTANRYLQETFIPDYWEKQIQLNPQNGDSEFTPAPKGTDLDSIFVVKDYRKIRTDHTFSYGNKYYLIESALRYSIAKQKIEIRTSHEDGFTAHFAERKLKISEVIEPTKPSMLDLDIQKKLEVLELAEQLGNVSEASPLSGVSRDTIHRHRRLIKEGGIQALKRQINEDHIHTNRTDQETAEAVNDVFASSAWYAKILNVKPHSNTEEDTHGNSYNRLLKRKQIIMQLQWWDVDDHPNITTRAKTPVGHGVVLWFELDDFDDTVIRARDIGAKFLEEPSRNPYALHREFWLADLDGYVVGNASPPES